MAIKLYLDEDVDPLLAQVLRDRNIDCLATQETKNRGRSDRDQLAFAAAQDRAILTFNVKDFVKLARDYAASGQRHSGIIVSYNIPFRELLRRTLFLFRKHSHNNLTDQLIWLQDYRKPDFS